MPRELTASRSRRRDLTSPASCRIPCGDEEHEIRWLPYELVIPAHPLDSERVLLELGGVPPACVLAWQAFSGWNVDVREPRILAALLDPTLRSPESLARIRQRYISLGDPSTRRYVTSANARLEFAGSTSHLENLLSQGAYARQLLLLPEAFQARGALTALRRCVAEWTTTHPAANAIAYVYGLIVGRTLADHVGDPASGRQTPVVRRCKVLPVGMKPDVRLTEEKDRVDVSLPIDWIQEVWAPGYSEYRGDLIVTALGHSRGLSLEGLRLERQGSHLSFRLTSHDLKTGGDR